MYYFKYSIYIVMFYCCLGYCDNKILIIGDSLSSAHGIAKEDGWVYLLEQKLQQYNYNYTVINASISGETTNGGINRLPNLIETYNPSIIIIALGSNDGLKGINLEFTKNNLLEMSTLIKKQDITPIIIRFRLPINYGSIYIQQFDNIFDELQQKYNFIVTPFLLDKFADDLSFFQADGLHPLAKAQSIMLNNIWPSIKPQLDK